jgi:general stress protein CsbA
MAQHEYEWKVIPYRRFIAIVLWIILFANLFFAAFFNNPYVKFLEKTDPYSDSDFVFIGITAFSFIGALIMTAFDSKYVEIEK